MTKVELKGDLHNTYTKYKQKHGKNNILGIFLIGGYNYGIAKKAEVPRYIVVYVPTFDELCIKRPIDIEEDNVRIIDIRKVYRVALNKDLNILEILFTDYYLVNPKYEELFNEYFYNNREELGRCNEKARLEKAAAAIKKAVLRQDYFEVMRLSIAAQLYMTKGMLVNDCFHISCPRYTKILQEVKDGFTMISTADALETVQNLIEYASEEEDIAAYKAIKEGVVKIIELALVDNVSYDVFREFLTKTEVKAFDWLLNELGSEKNITLNVSKVIEETSISRPVWTKLFAKMEKERVATVKNMGAAGTEIKFYN